MERQLFDLLSRDGAGLLFAAQMFGIFGLPIPDELLLTLAGGLVRRGLLQGPSTLVAAVGGSMTGVTFSYLLGRLGSSVVRRLGMIETGTVERVQSWLTRWQAWLLVFGCFIPGFRHVIPFATGSAPIGFRTFGAYAYPGCALWSTTFLAFGYYGAESRRWEHAALLLRAHYWIAALSLAGLVVAYGIISRHRRVLNG